MKKSPNCQGIWKEDDHDDNIDSDDSIDTKNVAMLTIQKRSAGVSEQELPRCIDVAAEFRLKEQEAQKAHIKVKSKFNSFTKQINKLRKMKDSDGIIHKIKKADKWPKDEEYPPTEHEMEERAKALEEEINNFIEKK